MMQTFILGILKSMEDLETMATRQIKDYNIFFFYSHLGAKLGLLNWGVRLENHSFVIKYYGVVFANCNR